MPEHDSSAGGGRLGGLPPGLRPPLRGRYAGRQPASGTRPRARLQAIAWPPPAVGAKPGCRPAMRAGGGLRPHPAPRPPFAIAPACGRGPCGSPTGRCPDPPGRGLDRARYSRRMRRPSLPPPQRLPADLNLRFWLVVRAHCGGTCSPLDGGLGCAPPSPGRLSPSAPGLRPVLGGSC